MVWLQKVRRTVPQGLKPKLFVTLYGTAEAVQLHDITYSYRGRGSNHLLPLSAHRKLCKVWKAKGASHTSHSFYGGGEDWAKQDSVESGRSRVKE